MRARSRPLSTHAYLVLCPCADCSAGVPAAWRRLSEFAPRPGQEKTAATKSGLWIHQSESPRERPAHEARLLHAAEQHDLPRLPLALRTAVERYEVMLQHYDEPVHAWVRELDDALTAAVALFGSRWRTVHPLITHHPRAKPLTLSSMRGRWCRLQRSRAAEVAAIRQRHLRHRRFMVLFRTIAWSAAQLVALQRRATERVYAPGGQGVSTSAAHFAHHAQEQQQEQEQHTRKEKRPRTWSAS